jgi:hypothetical protein
MSLYSQLFRIFDEDIFSYFSELREEKNYSHYRRITKPVEPGRRRGKKKGKRK